MASNIDLQNYLEENLLEFKSYLAHWINRQEPKDEFSNAINSKMKRIVNSIRFWSEKFKNLKNNRMFILTSFSLDDGAKISYVDILRNIEKITSLQNIQEIFIPENRNYVGIYFKTEEENFKVKKRLLKIDEAYAIDVDWYNELTIVNGRIHYIPPFITTNQVSDFLSKYLINVEIKKLQYSEYKGISIGSSVTSFNGVLKPNITVDTIPHFTQIGKNEILITIRGRGPICTKCRIKGHTRKECSYFYCRFCHVNVTINHDCDENKPSPSYASKLKQDLKYTESELTDYIENKEPVDSYENDCETLHRNDIDLKQQTCDSPFKHNILKTNIDKKLNVNINDRFSFEKQDEDKMRLLKNMEENNNVNRNIESININFVENCEIPTLKTLCQNQIKNQEGTYRNNSFSSIKHVEDKFLKTYGRGGVVHNLPPDKWSNEFPDDLFSPCFSYSSVEDINADVLSGIDNTDMEISTSVWSSSKKRKKKNNVKNDSFENNNSQAIKYVKIEEHNVSMENKFEPLQYLDSENL